MNVGSSSGETAPSRAWLLITTPNPTRAQAVRYDDEVFSRYSWDSTVANHDIPTVGDLVAVRDHDVLLGAAVIERLCITLAEKERHRCPECHRAGIRERSSRRPRFRCDHCTAEFNRPEQETIRIRSYQAEYGGTWQRTLRAIPAQHLRAFCCARRRSTALASWTLDGSPRTCRRKRWTCVSGGGLGLRGRHAEATDCRVLWPRASRLRVQ